MPKGKPLDGTWHGLEPLDAWVAKQPVLPCACGCGQPVVPKRHHRSKGIPRFAHGHHTRNGANVRERHPNWIEDRSKAPRRGAYFTPVIASEIRRRAGGKCALCSVSGVPLELDHIVPIVEGGSGEASNGQMLCQECHVRKTNADKRRMKEVPSWPV